MPEARLGTDADSVVSIHKIGVITTSEASASIPFTRLLGDPAALTLEIPFEGRQLGLGLSLNGSSLHVTIFHRAEEEADEQLQPDLFG
jgi:hypothetical protein